MIQRSQPVVPEQGADHTWANDVVADIADVIAGRGTTGNPVVTSSDFIKTITRTTGGINYVVNVYLDPFDRPFHIKVFKDAVLTYTATITYNNLGEVAQITEDETP